MTASECSSLISFVSAAMQDHGPVSDAAIGRALGNLPPNCGGDDDAETDSKNMNGSSTSADDGPLQQRHLEMVTTEHTRNRPAENDDSDIADEEEASNEAATYDFTPPPSSSSSEWIDRKFYKEKLRKLPPSITNVYDNWTCCDNETVTSGSRGNNHSSRNNNDDGGDEIAWKIIKGVLQGWLIIWVLFAIIIVAAEVTSPKTPHRVSTKYSLMLTKEDEQSFLTLSEKIVSKCSYLNLDTETGREECQSLCHQHMCCFNDENNFGCSDNPVKICAAYAGCGSLLISEDDAIIYDADGVDVFGIGDADDTDPLASNSSDKVNEGNEQSQNEAVSVSSYAIFELQLISEVINTVCSTGNLGTKHGLDECASLCNDGMCCFDREQIEYLNPKMDLILQLEGITAEKLDTSKMGTCRDSGKNKEHFCQVHASCKNMLLLGSHYSGVHNLNSDGVEEHGNYIVFAILFAIITVLTVYLLVFQRAGPVQHIDISRVRQEINAASSAREEMIEFV